MKKIEINPPYEHLRQYLITIPENFESLGEVIDARRNILREDRMGGLTLIIKSFKRIYLTNRIRYSFFHPSKAKRAFDNANILVERGFVTPLPVAYVEDRPNGIITESFFISEFLPDYRPLEDIFKPFEKGFILPATEVSDLLKQMAHYTFQLHQKNIFHIDYTLGNILYKKTGDQYEFALVDNNRMRFDPIDFETGIKNMVRFWLNPDQLEVVAREYTRLWNKEEAVGLKLLLAYRAKESAKNELERSFKKLLRPFKRKKQ